jgi:hypothetical protein
MSEAHVYSTNHDYFHIEIARQDIDMFLKPLMENMKILWEKEANMMDAS